MKNYDMREALYALPNGIIKPCRKPLAIPLLVSVIGVVLLVANTIIPAEAEYANLKSAIVLFGVAFVLVGTIISVLRFNGSHSAPWHTDDACFLKKEELKFVKERSSMVRDLVRKGDFTTLRSLPDDGVSAVMVIIYSSPRSSFFAMQAFEYIDLELQPITELKVVM